MKAQVDMQTPVHTTKPTYRCGVVLKLDPVLKTTQVLVFTFFTITSKCLIPAHLAGVHTL